MQQVQRDSFIHHQLEQSHCDSIRGKQNLKKSDFVERKVSDLNLNIHDTDQYAPSNEKANSQLFNRKSPDRNNELLLNNNNPVTSKAAFNFGTANFAFQDFFAADNSRTAQIHPQTTSNKSSQARFRSKTSQNQNINLLGNQNKIKNCNSNQILGGTLTNISSGSSLKINQREGVYTG